MGRTFYTVALVVFLTGTNAAAYPVPVDFNGNVSRWDIDQNSEPISVGIDGELAGNVGLQNLVIDAIDKWSKVESSYFKFRMAEPGEGEQVLLKFLSSLDDAPQSSGYAMFDELDSEQRPKHCEISIDLNQSGLAKTLLHELGHCVGLGHSIVPESIMSYRDDKNSYALDTDDAAAVTRLYPNGSGHEKLPPGCGVADPRQKASASVLLMFLVLPLLIFIRYRFNRKN